MKYEIEKGCDSFEEYLDLNNMGARCGTCLSFAEKTFDEIEKNLARKGGH